MKKKKLEAYEIDLDARRPLHERIADARAGDSEAALSLLKEFIATTDAHRGKSGEYHTLPCGRHIHLDPLLGDYLAKCFRPLVGSDKNDHGRRITADQALCLASGSKRGRKDSKNTEPRKRRIGKEIADLAFKLMAKADKKKGFVGNKNLGLYKSLTTYMDPPDDEMRKKRRHHPALKEAVRLVAKTYQITGKTAFRYCNEWLAEARLFIEPGGRLPTRAKTPLDS